MYSYYDHGVMEVMNGILSLGADVALLSENDLPDTLFSLVQRKIAPMKLYMGHRNSTAILSRYPVAEFKEIELPSHEASLSGSNDINDLSRQPHRSFVHAILNVDGTFLHVISIRFIAGRPKNNTFEENFRWGKYLLATQMQEVDAFTAYLSKLQGPIIFGGDLNAPPLSKPMRKIQNMATDAYMANHIWGDYTFRTDSPRMRLDYLFCMNQVIPDQARRPAFDSIGSLPRCRRFLDSGCKLDSNEKRGHCFSSLSADDSLSSALLSSFELPQHFLNLAGVRNFFVEKCCCAKSRNNSHNGPCINIRKIMLGQIDS